MPFLRITRDRRGFEYVAILHHEPARSRGKPRLLYFSRAPVPLIVGRPVLDEVTRHELEAAHPEVIFDWARLVLPGGRAR